MKYFGKETCFIFVFTVSAIFGVGAEGNNDNLIWEDAPKNEKPRGFLEDFADTVGNILNPGKRTNRENGLTGEKNSDEMSIGTSNHGGIVHQMVAAASGISSGITDLVGNNRDPTVSRLPFANTNIKPVASMGSTYTQQTVKVKVNDPKNKPLTLGQLINPPADPIRDFLDGILGTCTGLHKILGQC